MARVREKGDRNRADAARGTRDQHLSTRLLDGALLLWGVDAERGRVARRSDAHGLVLLTPG